MRLSIDDVRLAGHCVGGARDWFKRHGLNFRDFLKNGLDAETALSVGDGMAEQVVQRKMERELKVSGNG